MNYFDEKIWIDFENNSLLTMTTEFSDISCYSEFFKELLLPPKDEIYLEEDFVIEK